MKTDATSTERLKTTSTMRRTEITWPTSEEKFLRALLSSTLLGKFDQGNFSLTEQIVESFQLIIPDRRPCSELRVERLAICCERGLRLHGRRSVRALDGNHQSGETAVQANQRRR